MAVTFRPAVREDYQAICDLVPSAEELFLVYPKGKFPLTGEQLVKLLKRRVEPTVLLSGRRIAGFANFYAMKKGESAFVDNVIVDPSRRAGRLGEKILNYMIDLAFAKYELQQVRISVFNNDTSALLLCAGLGFKPYGLRVERDPLGREIANLNFRLKRPDQKQPRRRQKTR